MTFSETKPSQPADTDVLIVGAGPVGMALAIELGSRGIACVLIEKNARVGYNPRAKLTNVRSMALMRRWGLADRLRDASPMPPAYPSDIVFALRMNGPVLARFKNAFCCAQDGHEHYAESAAWLPQYTLEQVLLSRVRELPKVDVQFRSNLVAVEQGQMETRAVIEDADSGARRTLRARYVVGCDGGRSTVRQLLGIAMSGLGAISPNYNVLLRAPALAAMHDKGAAVQYWMVNSDVPALMGPMDSDGLWYLIATRIGDGVDPASIDPKALIRRSTGLDFEMEIVSTDPWTAHRLVADRYRSGRVFLAGDACHLHPPFGGYGMNMGLGDAVDLGWKLAAALQGWGGRGLLDSYEQERKPVHERVMDEAVENYSVVANQLAHADLERDDAAGERARIEAGALIKKVKLREFRSLGLVLGYRYKDSPLIIHDGSSPPAEQVTEYEPSAHPGCLAPHFWLNDGRSVYDCVGDGFTLFAPFDAAQSEFEPLLAQARERRIPMSVTRLIEDRYHALYGTRLCLVRTDHHVAWRGDRLPADPSELLDQILGAATVMPAMA
ncbi:MAG: FAD-dependent monooxygenase [Burkholderiaceae bacterium]